MNSRILRVELFAISYVPLFLILAIRTLPSKEKIVRDLQHHDLCALATPTAFLTLSVFGLVVMAVIVRHSRRISGTTLTLKSISDRGSEAAAYLATYILPFVMFDEDSWQVWAAFSVYLAVLAVVTVNSDLILTNPTLYLIRRRIAEATFERSRGPSDKFDVTALLVCKSGHRAGDRVEVVEFAGGYLEKY